VKKFVVTIDGPSGSGKSTVSKELGLALNWFVLESGALYRAVAFMLSEQKKFLDLIKREPTTNQELVSLCKPIVEKIKFEKMGDGKTEIFVNGEPVSKYMRTPKVSEIASIIARNPGIREILLPVQREVAEKERHLIAEGRDMGTCVFPDADLKFFLTATLEVRARRRMKELTDLGIECEYSEVLKQMIARDERDEKREVSPLKPAQDAILIDTSEMSIRQVVTELLDIITPRIVDEQEYQLYETRFRN